MDHFSKYKGETGYKNLVLDIIENGEERNKERTGTGTVALFGTNLAFDLQEYFPALTIRKINVTGAIKELLWFLRGEESCQWLIDQGVKYWKPWLDKHNSAGRVYGVQWRNWKQAHCAYGDNSFLDQIKVLLDQLTKNPEGRRHIVTAWNPGELDQMCLPPCHMIWQCYIRQGEFLDLHMYQRSADMILGVPHDVVMYAALNHMIAQVVGKKPGRLFITFGDSHVYNDHIEHVTNDWPERTPHQSPDGEYNYPQVMLSPYVKQIDQFQPNDFRVENYKPWPSPKLEVSV